MNLLTQLPCSRWPISSSFLCHCSVLQKALILKCECKPTTRWNWDRMEIVWITKVDYLIWMMYRWIHLDEFMNWHSSQIGKPNTTQIINLRKQDTNRFFFEWIDWLKKSTYDCLKMMFHSFDCGNFKFRTKNNNKSFSSNSDSPVFRFVSLFDFTNSSLNQWSIWNDESTTTFDWNETGWQRFDFSTTVVEFIQVFWAALWKFFWKNWIEAVSFFSIYFFLIHSFFSTCATIIGWGLFENYLLFVHDILDIAW
jgi:hypothetical protein